MTKQINLVINGKVGVGKLATKSARSRTRSTDGSSPRKTASLPSRSQSKPTSEREKPPLDPTPHAPEFPRA